MEDVPKVVPKSELEVTMTERVALNDRKLQDLSKSEIRVKSELEVPMTERVAQNDGELQGLGKQLAPTASWRVTTSQRRSGLSWGSLDPSRGASRAASRRDWRLAIASAYYQGRSADEANSTALLLGPKARCSAWRTTVTCAFSGAPLCDAQAGGAALRSLRRPQRQGEWAK